MLVKCVRISLYVRTNQLYGNITQFHSMADDGSKSHGWTPKLLFWFFNMAFNNVYRIYLVLHKRLHQQDVHVPQRLKLLTMDIAVESMCWSLSQKGEDVRKHKPCYPSPVKNMQYVIDTNGGHKLRSDIKNKHDKPHLEGTIVAAETTPNNAHQQQSRMNRKRTVHEWYHHQSECQMKRNNCRYKNCTGQSGRCTEKRN